MEGNTGFSAILHEALEHYKDHLDRTELPQLKEHYRILHTAYKGIYNVLLKKGLIHEDPYKHETKISEISNPPDEHFLESAKDDQMSIRLSMFESQLDFLLNYYQFSVEFLDLGRVKLLVDLTRYIAWDQLSEVSGNMTTRALAEYVGKIKKGGDGLSSGIVADSLDQIQRASKAALAILKNLANFHKENYKFEIRLSLLPNLEIDGVKALNQREDVMRQIKKRFASEMPGRPFYPELVTEILDEDYGAESDALKAGVVDRLRVKEKKTKVQNAQISFPAMLLDAIRAMAAVSRYLDEAIMKLVDNSMLLENKRLPFFERFKRWIVKLTQKSEEAVVYDVEYFDITTSSTKHENIQFRNFVEDVRKKARVYGGIMSKSSAIYKKIEKASEEQLFTFLNKHLEELGIILRRFQALDTFFKSEVSREDKAELRGIKIEITAIKNNLVKTNQKKHEYVAKKEENEQLKKLGINTSAT